MVTVFFIVLFIFNKTYIPITKSLEETLRRAMTNASSLKHEFATLEHLLFALLEDQDALEVLKACSVNVKTLEDDINKYLKEELDCEEVDISQGVLKVILCI